MISARYFSPGTVEYSTSGLFRRIDKQGEALDAPT